MYTEQKYKNATFDNFKDFIESQLIKGNQPIEISELGPNL
jgi:hypothetical protein